MKKTKVFFITFGKVLSALPISFFNNINSIRSCIYTGYYSRFFKSFHKTSVIHPYLNHAGLQYVSIGKDCVLGNNLEITAYKTNEFPECIPEIVIGNGCLIRHDSHITSVNSIRIGNNLLTGPYVLITDNSHGNTDYETLHLPPRKRPIVSKGPVLIGNNVWIGEKSTILPGVSVGDGAVIAANSVVTHDIPPYCVAAGIPARVISQK